MRILRFIRLLIGSLTVGLRCSPILRPVAHRMSNQMGLLCCSPTGSSGSHTRRSRRRSSGTTARAARRASRRRRRRSRSSIRRRTRPPYSRAGTSTCQRQSVSAVACAPTTLCDFSGYPRRTGCYTPLQWRSSGVGGRNAMQSGTGDALRRPLGRRAVGEQRLPSHPPHERRNGALDLTAAQSNRMAPPTKRVSAV